MKKLFLCLLILSITSPLVASCGAASNCSLKSCDSCDCAINSKSFFTVRPHFQSGLPELVTAFRNERLDARIDGCHGAVQAVIFGSISTDSEDLIRYFTPFCKTKLTIDSRPGEGDILAQHFNIYPTAIGEFFRSEISFEPKQTVIGLGLHYRQAFWRNEEKGRYFFFSVSSPLTHVRNKFSIHEQTLQSFALDETADENVVTNMVEAFNQKEWCYGKINSKIKGKCLRCPDQTKTRFADVELKLGIAWVEHEPCHLESYIGVIIPTGNSAKGEFIFEPIVGYGDHWGFMSGTSIGATIWSSEESDCAIRAEYAIHSQYLFSNCQIRSFDLRNKPFSRYIEVYANKAQAEEANALADPTLAKNLATPGINVFTRNANVTPGFSFNLTTAYVLNWGGFQGEVGYNFYARRAECISLACPWKLGPALKSALGAGATNPVRDITGNAQLETISMSLASYDANRIKAEDLDLASAAHPAGLSQTFFGALGYRWDECEYPIFISGGGSYEYSIANSATIDRWTIWGKVGLSF